MSSRNRSFKQLLLWLIAGSRGGGNRGKIIQAIKREPLNANQLSALLGVDYRTIRHHLNVLEKNHMIVEVGEHYGKVFFLSQELEQNYGDFEEIWNRIVKKLNNNDTE